MTESSAFERSLTTNPTTATKEPAKPQSLNRRDLKIADPVTPPPAPIAPVGGRIKRAFDFLAALAAIIFLSPVLVLIAITVRYSSGPDIIFKQERGGLAGKPFVIFKFRTMTVQENGDTVVQAKRDDDRVTGVGKLLRSTSLDELPQLFNVLRGDMSLIGPRPHALHHDNEFAKRHSKYRRRHATRPGITGLAQVTGFRGEIETDDDLDNRIAADIQYVDQWSMRLDLSILVRTILVVPFDKNAY
ncbi:MAG: sugar transferase [Pseudomonadota bacterium]